MQAFARVAIDYIVSGGARVSWELNRHLVDPAPYLFQLQVGHTGNNAASDWTDVGTTLSDTYYAIDTSKRLFGKQLTTHYRVKLTTPRGVYYSDPVNVEGHLPKRDWLIARELVRQEKLRHRALTSVEGYLLKAIRYGPPCRSCLDPLTGSINDSHCDTCYGTGFENGYFAPMVGQFADLSTQSNREHRNPQSGMEKQDVVQARFPGDLQIYSYDVWINKSSDERYYLQNIAVAAQHRGVPIAFVGELRLAPFSDVIYTVPLADESLPSKPPAG